MLKNGTIEIGDGDAVERAAAFVTKAGDALAATAPVAAVLARTAEARGQRSASRSPLTYVLSLGGLVLAVVAGTLAWRNRDRLMEIAERGLTKVAGTVGRVRADDEGDAETADPWPAFSLEPADPVPASAAEPVGSLPA